MFALPALLFAAAGTFSPFALLIFACFYGCVMAVVAKLSTIFRQSGGPQLYAQHAFGPVVGFQVGWLSLLTNMIGASANFHVLVSYLAAIFPFFADPFVRLATIATLIAFFTAISISGTKRSVRAIELGTVLKLAPLLLLVVLGFAQNGVPTDVKLPVFSEVESIALLLAFAFSGADVAVAAAGETKEPRKTLMRAIFINLAGIAIFYALIMWAYIAIAPDPTNVDTPLAAAGEAVLGPMGSLMISVAAIFSTATFQLNVFVALPRIAYGMARRGLMPHVFAYVSPRFQTPVAAIAGYGAVVSVLALSGSFTALAVLMVSVEQILFTSSIAALVVMWWRNDAGLRDTMDARWLVIFPVAIGLVLWLFSQVPWDSVPPTLAFIGVGFVLYLLSRRGAVAQDGIELPEARA
ncbi:amino acid/polyamine/organocation transporter, APC superfamily [Altererythrobacter xiamenensis]|uniref:Arginine/agmatine antiporter n=1 Tax=Altererythrobacter xiamenensis TaxID=1316679 RepID=A0A1Y6EPH4_9SPHN|nr:amino acid/polyamine/organocation transporter, APC superfamily [Altererythrobacter xiamenensis]